MIGWTDRQMDEQRQTDRQTDRQRQVDLLEIDALATGIGSSEYLHSAMFQIQTCVIWNERTDHHLLKWVSEGERRKGERERERERM